MYHHSLFHSTSKNIISNIVFLYYILMTFFHLLPIITPPTTTTTTATITTMTTMTTITTTMMNHLITKKHYSIGVHAFTTSTSSNSYGSRSSRSSSRIKYMSRTTRTTATARRRRKTFINTTRKNTSSMMMSSISCNNNKNNINNNNNNNNNNSKNNNNIIITISEHKWRDQCRQHQNKIYNLLQNGLVTTNTNNTNTNTNHHHHHKKKKNDSIIKKWTSLDKYNPIFNFLIEYYGLKGTKGTRRLARWSPDIYLLLFYSSLSSLDLKEDELNVHWINNHNNNDNSNNNNNNDNNNHNNNDDDENMIQDIIQASNGKGGIFLHNAKLEDLNNILHLRGAIPVIKTSIQSSSSSSSSDDNVNNKEDQEQEIHGVLYNPYLFYNNKRPYKDSNTILDNDDANDKNEQDLQQQQQQQQQKQHLLKTIAPFQWYKSILQTTINSEPIFHCHGLHEWAMVYHPLNSIHPTPPSNKYQSHLSKRISQSIINDTVEKNGIHCTHVDALRFFSPDAGQYNYHGSSLQRIDQLSLEQKGCVHAHMDLLKIALKLSPFINSDLLCDVIDISIQARTLDVEASPYDVSEYGGVAVKVETEEGRKVYRKRQKELMENAEPVRKRLLEAYNVFLTLAFDDELIQPNNNNNNHNGNGRSSVTSSNDVSNSDMNKRRMKKPSTTDITSTFNDNEYAAPERFARAEPGGLPWRQNLIQKE